jgi:hypothetical protein
MIEFDDSRRRHGRHRSGGGEQGHECARQEVGRQRQRRVPGDRLEAGLGAGHAGRLAGLEQAAEDDLEEVVAAVLQEDGAVERHGHARLLAQLADSGLRDRLAGIDLAARQAPEPRVAAVPRAQEPAVALDGDACDQAAAAWRHDTKCPRMPRGRTQRGRPLGRTGLRLV